MDYTASLVYKQRKVIMKYKKQKIALNVADMTIVWEALINRRQSKAPVMINQEIISVSKYEQLMNLFNSDNYYWKVNHE
jgi:hypothetical protein